MIVLIDRREAVAGTEQKSHFSFRDGVVEVSFAQERPAEKHTAESKAWLHRDHAAKFVNGLFVATI